MVILALYNHLIQNLKKMVLTLIDVSIVDDDNIEKALKKKPQVTRRKRKVVVEKTPVSESSGDEERKNTTKTRRSRSKSIEVGRKRGRPRKNQNPPSNDIALQKK